MTKRYLSLVAVVLFMLVCFNNPMYAFQTKGDTLVVEQTDQNTTPLNEIIAADTLADGSREHAVYELVPNGWYPLSGTITAATFDLNVVGGKRSGTEERPAILAKNDWSGWYMVSAGQNLTVKSVQLMQIKETAGGALGPWAVAGMESQGVDATVIFHDMIWDFNPGRAFWGAKNGLKLFVTNCLFRFGTAQDNGTWNGQGFDIREAALDTVLFQNCTWYGGGPFMVVTWQGTENLYKIDHCTFADFVQFPIHDCHYTNAVFSNNLFYNCHTMGEDSAQIKGQDPDELPYGVINVDTIYTDADSMAARSIVIANNNNFVKQNIKDYWATCMADPETYHFFTVADPTLDDGFLNSRTRAMFADDETWPSLVLENTTSLDPEFENYADYSDTLINYSKFKYNYAWPGAVATTFMKDPDGDELLPTNPMFYNLKINNAALRTASTSGGPIGDLTWELPNGYNSTQMEMVTAVEKRPSVQPDAFSLQRNYPNPFNPTTNINFTVATPSHVELTVYNISGQKVATLVNKQMSAGSYNANWDASRMSSGVYFYTMKVDNYSKTYKMMLMK